MIGALLKNKKSSKRHVLVSQRWWDA